MLPIIFFADGDALFGDNFDGGFSFQSAGIYVALCSIQKTKDAEWCLTFSLLPRRFTVCAFNTVMY